MVQHQRNIKPELKRRLIDEAGGKCAYPGCPNRRPHIHHIKPWAVYKNHDAAGMIAVCPACHDSIHHGNLEITDGTLYDWKKINRSTTPDTAHIYVEPAPVLKLLTGSISLSTVSDHVAVFELSNTNHLKIRVLDSDILKVTSRLQNLKGKEVVRIVENDVRVVRDRAIEFKFRAGLVRVTVPASEEYIPTWVVQLMRKQKADFADDDRVTAFDIEVVGPGLVRVEGFWPAPEGAFVITKDLLSFCRQGASQPVSIVGAGENSVLMFAGPINSQIFRFG